MEDVDPFDALQGDDIAVVPMVPMMKGVSDYGDEVDYWVLEDEEPVGGSLFDRIPSGEVDGAVKSLRNGSVGFDSKRLNQNDRDIVSVSDQSPNDVTVATYGGEHGMAYNIRDIGSEDVPDEIMDIIPTSIVDSLPIRKEEAYELTLVSLEGHDYDLDNLASEGIDEAQRAINEVAEKIESGDYDSRAWGHNSRFGI